MGEHFAAAVAMLARLPLTDAERAEAVRRLLAEAGNTPDKHQRTTNTEPPDARSSADDDSERPAGAPDRANTPNGSSATPTGEGGTP